MSWHHLVWCGLMRKPIRTALTIASMTTAFLLFGLLAPMLLLLQNRGDLSGAARLIVQPRHSIADFLPISAEENIKTIPVTVRTKKRKKESPPNPQLYVNRSARSRTRAG